MIINNSFITTHEPLVRLIVFQYHYPHLHDDLLQEGRMALLYAAKRFNPDRGITFPSYASWWIHKFVQSAIRCYGHVVNYPISMPMEIPHDISINQPLAWDEDETLTLADLLSNPNDRPEEQTENQRLELQDQALYRILSSLSHRAQFAIKHFYGIGTKPLSIDQIALRLHSSQKVVYNLLERNEKIICKKMTLFHQQPMEK